MSVRASTLSSAGENPNVQAPSWGAEVVKRLHGGKTPRMHEICPEFLKALDVVGLSWLICLCNIALTSGAVPLDWQTGVVVPLLWDQWVCSSYRGITLPSLPGKVHAGVLEKRVQMKRVQMTFSVRVGLRQGCPLSLILFITFLDRISRNSQGAEGVPVRWS